MRSILELRSPSNGTGWGDTWTFSGGDDRMLRDCLDGLEEYATEPPIERRTRRDTSHAAAASDRWRAAMLFSDDDKAMRMGINAAPRAEVRAWTSDGALQLAEVLPEQLGDLRNAIIERFSQA